MNHYDFEKRLWAMDKIGRFKQLETIIETIVIIYFIHKLQINTQYFIVGAHITYLWAWQREEFLNFE